MSPAPTVGTNLLPSRRARTPGRLTLFAKQTRASARPRDSFAEQTRAPGHVTQSVPPVSCGFSGAGSRLGSECDARSS